LSREGLAETKRLCCRALEIDPRYGFAAFAVGQCCTRLVSQGWAPDTKSELAEAMRLFRLALSIDENDPEALAAMGRMTAYVIGDFDAATEMVDRAIILNPNSWMAWQFRGQTFTTTGNFEEALRSFERAIRLSPLDPLIFGTYTAMAIALIGLGRFDDALVAAKKALRKNQTYSSTYRCLAAALAHLGRGAETKDAVARLLELEPNFHISEWVAGRRYPQVYVDGLRKAGLSE
jgi:adenylate cyclase